MKRYSFVRKLFVLLVFIGVSVSLGTLLVEYALQALLRQVFTDGTRCSVALDVPALRLFPARGEVSNVSIRCKDETANQGFFASRVSTRIRLGDLLAKKVTLLGLSLEGVRARSESVESAFFRTIDFIVEDTPPAPPAWHDFISTNWRVSVDSVSFHGEASAERPDLVLRSGARSVFARSVKVLITDHGDQPTSLAATAQELEVHAAEQSLPLGALETRLVIGDGLVKFERFFLEPSGPGSRISITGRMLIDEETKNELTVDAVLAAPYVRAHFGEYSDLISDSEISIQGEIRGEFSEPGFDGHVALRKTVGKEASFGACVAPTIDLNLKLNQEALTVDSVTLGTIPVAGEFKLSLTDKKQFSLRSRADTEIAPDALAECLNLHIAGSELTAAADLARNLSDALRGGTLEVSAQGELAPLAFSASLKSELYARVVDKRSVLSARIDLSDQHLLFDVSEQIDSPEPEKVRALQAKASYGFTDRSVALSDVSLKSYPVSRLFARAMPFLPSAAIRTVATFVSPETVITGSALGSITPDSAGGEGEFVIQNVVLPGDEQGSIALKSVLGGDRITVSDISVRSGSDAFPVLRAAGEADLRFDGEISGRVRVNRFDLAALPTVSKSLPALNGILGAEGYIDGTFSQPRYHAEISIDTPSGGPTGLLRSSFKLQGDAKALQIDGTVYGGRGTAALALPFDGKSRFSFVFSADELPLSCFLATAQGFEVQSTAGVGPEYIDPAHSMLTGGFEYSALSGDPAGGSGKLLIGKLRMVGTELELSQDRPLQITMANGRVSFDSVSLIANGRGISLEGYLDRVSGWRSTLSGEWDLSTILGNLEALNRFDHLAGLVSTSVSITGPMESPQMEGTVRLRGGALGFPVGNSSLDLSQIEADGIFRGGEFSLERFIARGGDGRVSANGRITDMLNDPSGRIEIRIERFVLEPAARLVLAVGGELAVVIRPNTPMLVEGLLKLDDSSYEDRIDLLRLIQTLTRRLIGSGKTATSPGVVRAQTASASANLQLRIQTESPIIVDTDVLDTALRVDLTASGTTAAPRLDGVIDATDGVFDLQTNTFELLSGEVVFSGLAAEINPRLNIASESLIEAEGGEDHRVRMNITGTLRKPLVAFSSDTGLNENQIIGLLGRAGGATGFTVIKGGGERRNLFQLLNPVSRVPIRERLSGLTGFSEVQIEPAFSSSTGEFTPRVTAKRPLPADLELKLSSELTGEQSSEARVEYPLTFQTGVFAGWKTGSATNSAEGNTGSIGVGVRYSTTFPGVSVFPQKMRSDEE